MIVLVTPDTKKMCLHKPSAAPLVPALQTLTVSRALLALESLLLDIDNVTALHEVLDRESEREEERVCERVRAKDALHAV